MLHSQAPRPVQIVAATERESVEEAQVDIEKVVDDLKERVGAPLSVLIFLIEAGSVQKQQHLAGSHSQARPAALGQLLPRHQACRTYRVPAGLRKAGSSGSSSGRLDWHWQRSEEAGL